MAEYDPNVGEAPVIVTLSGAAMHMYTAAIDALPFPEDKKFHKRADVVLSGLRKLRAGLTEAASRNRSTPEVIVELSQVRRRYDDLMTRAATAPGSSLGQQLYAARRRASLSAQEVANGAGLRGDLLDDLEAGEAPTEDEATKIKELLAALGWEAHNQHIDHHQQPDGSQINGWEESFAEANGE
jgi:ribosome-binding protein aMBF1 (putative translation factor)